MSEELSHRGDEPISVTLQDGTHLLLRPVDEEDAAGFRDGFERLSKESRYSRFLHATNDLPDWVVDRLVHIDHHDQEAWVAIDMDLSSDQPVGVGVARYVRTEEDPRQAEIAVTVVDSHQHRGVATRLALELARSAMKNGIDSFKAIVLGDNDSAQALAQRFGAQATEISSGLVELEFDLDSERLSRYEE